MADTISATAGAEGGAVDLFGAPIAQIRERWGRPSFAKSKENQQLVAVLRAARWSHGRIAAYLGCDEKTLRKHFSRELERGDDIIEGMCLEVTMQKVREGHAPSVTRMLEVVDRGRGFLPPAKAEPEPKEEKLGKKAQAERDAVDAHKGNSWDDLLGDAGQQRPN